MRVWTIDAFASAPFGGNPACVVEPFADWPPDAWMQAFAWETHAGAAAFMRRPAPDGPLDLRWFTPFVEVPLCGHATLAAAHALFRHLGLEGARVDFETRSGPLSVARRDEAYEISLAAQPATRIATPPGLAEALGAEPVEVWAGAYLVVLLASADEVRRLAPDLAQLQAISARLGGQGNVGVAAAAELGAPHDVVDRFFAPAYGLPEDAATGSFHGLLAPIMCVRLQADRLRFHQAFPGRGADFTCRLDADRVLVCGEARTVLESRWLPPAPTSERG